MTGRAARLAWALVGASLVATLAAMLWFVARTLFVRLPYWGEAEVLFEASRLREHLPLWVDPLVGAAEHGAPPSRFYVTYPPLWTWVVSLVPASIATSFARMASTLAWLGTLGGAAFFARRDARAETTAAAAFVAGIWVLANFATIGRPDAIAGAIAAVALFRATRDRRLDPLTIALLVLVPWVKPTIIGLPAGALVAGVILRRDARALATAAGFAAVSAAVAHVASGGLLFVHVVRSNAQPFSLDAWLDQVPGRLPFFAPLFVWAAWTGWRDRTSPATRVALGALAGATLWTLVALAKTGSSSNYWMEPCIAAVVLLARAAPGPVRFGAPRLRPAACALAATLWADVAAVRGSIEHARTMREDAAYVAALTAMCPGVIAADEAGIELVLDGRILIPTYQMAHLVRSGAFPAAPWVEDLGAVGCYVEHTGQLRLVPELGRALDARFVLATEHDGFRVWRRRAAP